MRIDLTVRSVTDIDYESLLQNGKSVFLFDFDNTINLWKSSEIPDKVLDIFEYLKSKGATVVIVSNGKPRKLNCEVQVIWRAMKPLVWKVKIKLKELLQDKEKVVVIGDQLFTDVLFGNLLGAFTIKVDPLDTRREFLSTKILRLFERLVFKFQRKSGERC
ncbi:YqeG family HAD IIIA-type phosphatase [Fervidobacterium thailandense]|uniref:YqeG family HAD IIIA-type phosphatase n=1 Tax=Fervidobacterium thailandense TaxID=1008305 RepID=UPI0008461743|nr:HAD-IIIA family hydrolase [Fervidobacterium thailandense]